MATWKGREKALLAVVIGLAVLYLSDRLFFSSLRARRQALRREMTAEEVTLRTGVAIQKRRGTILKEQKTYAVYWLPALPDRELIATFLKEIERVAQESGASIVDLTPDNQPSRSADAAVYKAQLKAEATVEQLLNLLHRLQTSRLLVKLDRFSLTPKDEQASTLRLEATVSLVVP